MEENKVEVLDENENFDNKNRGQGPNNRKSIFLIILIFILMVTFFIGGYFISESNLFENSKIEDVVDIDKSVDDDDEINDIVDVDKNVDNVEENEKSTDDVEENNNLINNLLKNSFWWGRCKALETYTNDKKFEVSDVTNIMAYYIAISELGGSSIETIKLEDVEKVIKKYFGKNYVFNPNSIDYKEHSCSSYDYDNSTKTFNRHVSACGGTCGPMTDYKIVKENKIDEELKIDVKVLFVSLDEGKDGIYSDYQKNNKIGNIGDDFASLYSKGSDYQFTFRLEDDNYVFVSSEPIK